jgi:threonine-phosphate decarboxylase
MIFLCNPNNPTGMLMKQDAVLKIADAAREKKSYLIVDEAYIDFCSDESVIRDVERNPYLIVLRSLSSFYALPGLRLGYGVFPEHLMARLNEQKEPWTVNSLSQRAAVVALKDKVFRKESLKVITMEKRFLEKNLKKIGIEYFNSDTHFFLVKMDNAIEICRQLRTKGILVRNCENLRGLDSSYIRIAVKSHRENTMLIKALTSILQQGRATG